jgi:uncharacterized protein (DUF1330 family)
MSVYLIIQGRFREGKEDVYMQYLHGVAPLMKEYGIEITAVGAGAESEFTNKTFPVNSILSAGNIETFNAFLGDARYAKIKKFRDEAYAELNLSIFEARPPKVIAE